MKKCIFIFSVLFILFSCQNANNNNDMNNGIDKRILQVIDSLPSSSFFVEQQFVTIDFTLDTLLNPIIRVTNSAVIPAPEWKPYREVLITEVEWFKGYKKYNDRYILFLHSTTLNNKFDRFVVIDSLKFDEEPYEKYDVYDRKGEREIKIKDDVTEKFYRITENDSLILLNRYNDNLPKWSN